VVFVEKTELKWLALFVGAPLIPVAIGYFVYFTFLYRSLPNWCRTFL